jgi:hypothetical protein
LCGVGMQWEIQFAVLIVLSILQALVATTHALSNNEEFPEATSLQDILVLGGSIPFGFVDFSG